MPSAGHPWLGDPLGPSESPVVSPAYPLYRSGPRRVRDRGTSALHVENEYGWFAVEVAAPVPERAAAILDAVHALALPPAPPPPAPTGQVYCRFWMTTALGPSAVTRELDAPTWDDISPNYATATRDAVATLSRWDRPPEGGRLLLMHGPAGTGKTTAIRALAREWIDWCDLHYIVDPDAFFGQAAYMMEVILGENYGGWRLVVVEDAEELIVADAKRQSGQALGRLLNLCDGLIGQGLRTLVLITTNAPVDDLHPAIVRPGRCLANVSFPALDGPAADLWRIENGLPPSGVGASLADLYAEDRASRREQATIRAAGVRHALARLRPGV